MMISEKKEEKRWSEGWAVLMADGYGEKRVAWEEKRKRKKKERDGLRKERGKEMVSRMGCVNGKWVWREESGLGREEEEEKKMKEKRWSEG